MSRSQLPLNALRAFEAAARHASFTHAAEELHVTQAAVSHQVKALEERGLVGRVVDPVDGRASLLQTTSAGARLIENLRAHALAGVGRAVEGWTGDEQRQFVDLFERFVAALVDTPTR